MERANPPRSSVGTVGSRLPTPKGKQKEVLAVPPEGHMVVLGTAGSGKTTMAIHRAANLANPLGSNSGRVLLVTYNRTLVAYLNYWRPAALANVTIENYHAFALGYLNSVGKMGPSSICKEPQRRELVERAVATVAGRRGDEAPALFERPLQFFLDEIEFLARYGIDGEDYVESDRFGRGAGFSRQLRPALLEVREEYLRLRAAEDKNYDWEDVAGGVIEGLADDERERTYHHVVIDEGQDFSPQMLRSLAAAVPADGSLTFFGDMAQQIYGRQVSWSRAGLDVSTVWRFRRNYRNTPEIADLGLKIAAMPYYSGVPDMVEPDEFEPSGPLPSLVRFRSFAEEKKFVVDTAKAAAQTGRVGVLMRRHKDEERFRQAFEGGQYLHKKMTWDPRPGISWGTVHAAKGLEFDTVILVGLSADRWPEPKIVGARGPGAAAEEDGPLLYVGVTRARRELVMTSVGQPTALLPDNDGLWQEQRA
jgi:superfamily I DNA/RNA helicase